MKVYEAIAEIVEREGVDAVFAVMGDANMKWLALCRVPVYYARHEGSAIGMADGYARATGKLAVCTVTCGPGLALLANSLVTASRNRTPLVVIAGDAPRADKYYEQAFDQRRFVEATETIAEDLRSAASVDEDFRDAFYLARTIGPVVLSAPFDLLEEEAPERSAAYTTSRHLLADRQEITPDPDVLERAAALIAAARRPIIVAGRGAIADRDSVIALADATGALLATSMKAKGLFGDDPRDLGLSGGFALPAVRERFAGADVVIGVGAGFNHYTTDHGKLFPQAEVVQITEEAAGLMGGRRRPHAHPGGRASADIYLRASVRPALAALLERLGGPTREPWAAPLGPPAVSRPPAGDSGLHPAEVMLALDAVAEQSTRFVIGLGHNWWFPLTYLRGRSADAYHVTMEFGSIGLGLTGAIGAALGLRDRKHVLIEGDASVMMAIQELDTAARYGADLLVIVMNDEGLGAEAHKLRAFGLDETGALMRSPDFAAIARACGGDGARIDSLDAFRDAVVAYQREGGVRLLDVRISQRVLSGQYAKFALPEPAAAVAVDHELCNGVGMCASSYPELFELGPDGKSRVVEGADLERLDGERLAQARDLCPWGAITTEMEENGV